MHSRAFLVNGEHYVVTKTLATDESPPEAGRELSSSEVGRLAAQWLSEGRWEALAALHDQGFTASEPWEHLVAVVSEVARRVPALIRVYRIPTPSYGIEMVAAEVVDLSDLAPTENPQALTWVEVEFRGVDDRPMREVAVQVELPNGSVVDVETDAFGVARIDDIAEPGQCTFKFPGVEDLAPTAA